MTNSFNLIWEFDSEKTTTPHGGTPVSNSTPLENYVQRLYNNTFSNLLSVNKINNVIFEKKSRIIEKDTQLESFEDNRRFLDDWILFFGTHSLLVEYGLLSEEAPLAISDTDGNIDRNSLLSLSVRTPTVQAIYNLSENQGDPFNFRGTIAEDSFRRDFRIFQKFKYDVEDSLLTKFIIKRNNYDLKNKKIPTYNGLFQRAATEYFEEIKKFSIDTMIKKHNEKMERAKVYLKNLMDEEYESYNKIFDSNQNDERKIVEDILEQKIKKIVPIGQTESLGQDNLPVIKERRMARLQLYSTIVAKGIHTFINLYDRKQFEYKGEKANVNFANKFISEITSMDYKPSEVNPS
ncbi:MAG: hypothetical protein KKF44_02235 [Nanoarchaeota archaeon]|nr:hypothetical protein [Nanoarchaeota archaeon]